MSLKFISNMRAKVTNASISASCFALMATGLPLDALAQKTLKDTAGSIVGNVIAPVIMISKWGAYLAGGVFVISGLMAAYKKSHAQGGQGVESKEIFGPLVVGGLLLSVGSIIDIMSNSMNISSSTVGNW